MRVEMVDSDLLGQQRLRSIIALKSQHWPHPAESQTKWFMQNVTATDRHMLGWKDNLLIGYLRIVSALGVQDRNCIALAIFDTVCIDRNHQRQSLGLELMTAGNAAIHVAGRVGLLACPPHLLPFYERCHWTLFPSRIKAAAEMRALLPEGHAAVVYDPASRLNRSPLQVSAFGLVMDGSIEQGR